MLTTVLVPADGPKSRFSGSNQGLHRLTAVTWRPLPLRDTANRMALRRRDPRVQAQAALTIQRARRQVLPIVARSARPEATAGSEGGSAEAAVLRILYAAHESRAAWDGVRVPPPAWTATLARLRTPCSAPRCEECAASAADDAPPGSGGASSRSLASSPWMPFSAASGKLTAGARTAFGTASGVIP